MSSRPYTAAPDPGGHEIAAASLVLNYGPAEIAYTTDDPAIRFVARQPHARFCVEGRRQPDLTLRWKFGRFRPSSGPLLQAGGDVWEARSLGSDAEEIVFYETRDRIPALRLEVDRELRYGRVTETPLGQHSHLVNVGRYPFDEFVVSRILGRSGSLLLHASAVLLRGEAVVFVGHSGAGKSTIARLMEDAGLSVLTDDRTILTAENGAIEACGTPWHGTHRRALARRAPLRALFLLNQAGANSVSPISQTDAIKELFVRLIQPRVRGNEVAAGLDTLALVTRQFPLQRFDFTRSTSASDFLLALLGD